MDAAIRQLRTTARQLARGKHRSGIRYPAPFRDAVVAVARTRVGHGQSLAQMARDVGVSFPTLTTWLAGPAELALRPVTLAPAPDPVATPPATIVLVTPEGFRVEGLDGETLVAVLRSLR